jgi:signal transduction histidine kinase
MITILMGIGIPIYATVFVRAQLDHTFVLQVLIATVCFVAYFYVRRIEQVYKASIFIITLLSFLLISIMISSALGDNSGAYHHVATIILATSFLLGQRFALLCYLLFLILYLSICSGYWHYFFPNTILPLHPARTSIFIDRILEINCVYSLAFLYDRLKISQQARIKEQEREVAKQEKQLSINRMAGGIAHEINNPLAILLGYLEILERHEFSKKRSGTYRS